MFNAPIPLQSLNTEPKNFPWEKPPEMSDLKEVIDYYMNGLTKEPVIDNLIQLLEMKTPVDAIVNSYTTYNVMKGMHNVDVKLLVSPVIHEYIKSIGNKAGVDVVDWFTDNEPIEDKETIVSLINKEIDSIERKETDEEDDEGVELMRQTADMLSDSQTVDEPMETEMEEENLETMETPQEKGMGLMSRRGME